MQETQIEQKLESTKMKHLKEKIIHAEQTIKFQKLTVPLCVGLVDIVNSTSISTQLSNIETAKYYTIFLDSMTRIIHEHDGIIVKNIGDSLLYYFQMENDRAMQTQPLECGVTILECKEIINEILKKEGLPKLQYRISTEYGNVMVASTSTIMDVDVFGSTVNYCAKINKLADPDEFIIGQDYQTIIKKTKEFHIYEKPSFKTCLKNDFPIYSVKRE